VEELTTKGALDGSIRFECAAYCWAKNVEVTVRSGEGIAVNKSFRCEIRDSYIHDAAWATPGIPEGTRKKDGPFFDRLRFPHLWDFIICPDLSGGKIYFYRGSESGNNFLP
jgi:hypothetical protein